MSMTPTGWYDDPSGEPGLYAFWNGREWGERSRTPPEGPARPLRAPRPEGRGRTDPPPIGWILVLAIVIFIASAVILAVTR